MKQEVKDIVLQAVLSAPTSLYALLSKLTIAEWTAILLGLLQGLLLIRKWWRDETEWGLRMKRWARGDLQSNTKPTELDE